MCANPVWLVFHYHDVILKKKKENDKKEKDILTWKQATKRRIQNPIEHLQ